MDHFLSMDAKQFIHNGQNRTASTVFIPCDWYNKLKDNEHANKLMCLALWDFDKFNHMADEGCCKHAITAEDNTKKQYCDRLYNEDERTITVLARLEANNPLYQFHHSTQTICVQPTTTMMAEQIPSLFSGCKHIFKTLSNLSDIHKYWEEEITKEWLDQYIQGTFTNNEAEDDNEEHLVSPFKVHDKSKKCVKYTDFISQAARIQIANFGQYLGEKL